MSSLLPSLPEWVNRLREHHQERERGRETDGQAGEHPFRWLDAADSKTRTETILKAWDAALFTETFKKVCRARITRSIPLASLVTPRAPRLLDSSEELLLLFDPERPEGLFAALGLKMPSLLWVPLGQTIESLSEALSAYLVDAPRSVHVLRRVERVFKGTAEQLGVKSLDEFGRVIAMSEPWIDSPFWSNAEDDDPWPMETSSLSTFELRALLNDCRQQIPTRFEARAFRTLWSRSVLRIERHPFDAFALEFRYEPSSHPHIVRDLEAYFPFQLPEDMPVDLVVSLLRGPTMTRTFLSAMWAKQGPSPFLALAACAIAPGETTTQELLRSLLDRGGDFAEVAIELSSAYGFRALLLEALAICKDEALRGSLEQFLAPNDENANEENEDEEDDA